MADPVKRILIVGLGSIGRRHMTNLSVRFPTAAFTVLRQAAVRDDLCERFGARVVTDLDAALADGCDLAVISSPSSNHIDTLPALIANGCAMLVEKPIVASLADCDAVLEMLAHAPKAVRISGFNFRHIPSLIKMQRLVQSGALGTIVRASFTAGQWLPDWRPAQDYRQSYSADAARGGGVELDLVHEIDVARWLFGDLTLQFAQGGRLSSLGLASNDVSAMIFTGQSNAPIVQVTLDYVSRKRLRHYEVVGDKAGLCWDIGGMLDQITPDGRSPLTLPPGGFDVAQSYIDMVDRIAAAMAGDWQEPLQTLEDGIASTRLALQARERGTKA